MPGCVPGAAVLWGSTYRVRPLPQSLSTCCPPCSCPAVLPPTYPTATLHLRGGLARTEQAYACMDILGLIRRVNDSIIGICGNNELGKNRVHQRVSEGEARLRCIAGHTHTHTHVQVHVHAYTQHAKPFMATAGGREKSMCPGRESQQHCH